MNDLSICLTRGISTTSITLLSKKVALRWIRLHNLGLTTISTFLSVIVHTNLALVGGAF